MHYIITSNLNKNFNNVAFDSTLCFLTYLVIVCEAGYVLLYHYVTLADCIPTGFWLFVVLWFPCG